MIICAYQCVCHSFIVSSVASSLTCCILKSKQWTCPNVIVTQGGDFLPRKVWKDPQRSGFSICDAVPYLAVLSCYLRVLYETFRIFAPANWGEPINLRRASESSSTATNMHNCTTIAEIITGSSLVSEFE